MRYNSHVLIYDAECGFCRRAALFAQHTLKIEVRPWQSTDLTAYGLTPEQCAEAVQWVGVDDLPRSGGQAIAEAFAHGPAPWPYLGATLELEALRPGVQRVYEFIAHNRGTLSRFIGA